MWDRPRAAAQMKKPIPGKGALAQTFEWIKNTLPQNTIIAANWPHGTQLNVLGNVKTIVDSDHFIPHWIHLYYRHVHYAPDPYEALTFLKTHNATHIMLTEREVIERSHVYSQIGSTVDNDRHFQFYHLNPIETPIGSPYQLRPHPHQTPIAFIDMISITPSRIPGDHVHIEPGAQQKVGVTIHLRTHHKISKEIIVNKDTPTIQTVGLGKNGGIVFEFDAHARLQNAHYIPHNGWYTLAIELFLKGKYNDVCLSHIIQQTQRKQPL